MEFELGTYYRVVLTMQQGALTGELVHVTSDEKGLWLADAEFTPTGAPPERLGSTFVPWAVVLFMHPLADDVADDAGDDSADDSGVGPGGFDLTGFGA